MSQFTLIDVFGYKLRVHAFYNEDMNGFHSHPRAFCSVCLWGGYTEYLYGNPVPNIVTFGSITLRGAEACHRVVPSKFPTITLAVTTPIIRKWDRKVQELRIAIIGKPCSGKGTLGKMLSERYGIPHISIGDVVRGISKDVNHPLHQEVIDSFGGAWKPLDDELSVNVAKYAIGDKKSFIIDGFPRNQRQHELFNMDATHVFYLKLEDKECMFRRISRNREGDSIQSFVARMKQEAVRLPILISVLKPIFVEAKESVNECFAYIIKKIEI